METLKGLLQHMAERFIAGLILASIIGGIAGIVNSCQPSDENSSSNASLEQLDISNP